MTIRNKYILLSSERRNWKNLERGTNTCLYTKSAIYTVLTKKVRYNAFKKDIQNKRNKDILLIHILHNRN